MIAAALDRERLVKLLGMLGSDHPGEIVNAARQAERLRREAGTTWRDIVLPALPNPEPRSPTVKETVAYVLDRWDFLTDWEIDFAKSIERQRDPLSPKQRDVLDRLVEKCRRADAGAV